jgi:hypothetical protein
MEFSRIDIYLPGTVEKGDKNMEGHMYQHINKKEILPYHFDED